MQDRRVIAGIVGLAIAAFTFVLMLPDEKPNTPDTLPWTISHPRPDTTRVFGVTLGETTLGEVERALHDETEISLFKSKEGGLAVEAYLQEINLNGLKAQIVMTIAVPPEAAQAMFERGLRMSSTPSGKRITLTPEDLERVRATAVVNLTYLPSARLEEAVVAKRFGTPALRVREAETDTVHWLYPQHGLGIALAKEGKAVLQYVRPGDFARLRDPLLAGGEVLK